MKYSILLVYLCFLYVLSQQGAFGESIQHSDEKIEVQDGRVLGHSRRIINDKFTHLIFGGYEPDFPQITINLHSLFPNQHDVQEQIRTYLHDLDRDTQRNLVVYLTQFHPRQQEELLLQLINRENDHGFMIFPDKPQLQVLVNLFWNSLTGNSQNLIKVHFNGLRPDQQGRVIMYLMRMAGPYLGQSGVRFNLQQDTLEKVIQMELQQELNDIDYIITSGKWPAADDKIAFYKLFVGRPDLQMQFDIFWNRLTPNSKKLLNTYLGSLSIRQQRRIILYLMEYTRRRVKNPSVSIEIRLHTIQKAIAMDRNNELDRFDIIIDNGERPVIPIIPENTLFIHQLFLNKPTLQEQLIIFWNSLTINAQNLLKLHLKGFTTQQQERILLYLAYLAGQQINQPGVKIDLYPEIIEKVILKEHNNDLQEIVLIIHAGEWPQGPDKIKIPFTLLFPTQPALQTQIDLFWNSLTNDAKRLLELHLRGLYPDQQQRILIYLVQLIGAHAGKPGTQIHLPEETIQEVIKMEQSHQLVHINIIIGNGEWPVTPNKNELDISGLFLLRPELKIKIYNLWNKLTEETKNLLNIYVGVLPNDQKERILLFILKLAERDIGRPGVKISLDLDTIKKIIQMDNLNKLDELLQIIINGDKHTTEANTERNEIKIITVIIPDYSTTQPTIFIDLDQIFPNKPDIKVQINEYLVTLPKEMQTYIYAYLQKFNIKEQADILYYLVNLNKTKPGIVHKLDWDALKKLIELNQKDQIEIENEIPVDMKFIFPNRPDLQEAIRFFFKNLSKSSKDLIRIHLAQLSPDAQGRILLYLINASKNYLGKPGIKINIDLKSLEVVIEMYKRTGLVGLENGIYPIAVVDGKIKYTEPLPPDNVQLKIKLQIEQLFPGKPDLQEKFIQYLNNLKIGPSYTKYEYDTKLLHMYFAEFMKTLEKEGELIVIPVDNTPIAQIDFVNLIPGNNLLQIQLRQFLERLNGTLQESLVAIFSHLNSLPHDAQQQLLTILVKDNGATEKFDAIIQWISVLPISVTSRLKEITDILIPVKTTPQGPRAVDYEKLLPGNIQLQVTLRKFLEGLEANSRGTLELIFSSFSSLPTNFQYQLQDILVNYHGNEQVTRLMQWISNLPKSIKGDLQIISGIIPGDSVVVTDWISSVDVSNTPEINYVELIPGNRDLQEKLRVIIQNLDQSSQKTFRYIFHNFPPLTNEVQSQLDILINNLQQNNHNSVPTLIKWVSSLPSTYSSNFKIQNSEFVKLPDNFQVIHSEVINQPYLHSSLSSVAKRSADTSNDDYEQISSDLAKRSIGQDSIINNDSVWLQDIYNKIKFVGQTVLDTVKEVLFPERDE